MSTVLKCDICKRAEDDAGMFDRIHHYALKREDRYGWDKLDICESCRLEIRKRVRNGGTDENKA